MGSTAAAMNIQPAASGDAPADLRDNPCGREESAISDE